MHIFFNIEIIFGTIVILCSFILSLGMFKKTGSPPYLKNFYLYPLLALLLSIFTILNNFTFQTLKVTKTAIENLYIILELFFWSYFFLNLFNTKRIKTLVRILFLLSFFLTIYLISNSALKSYNHKILSINNLLYVFYCCIYFFNLFKNTPTKKLKSDPVFFIILGIFFYAVFSLPLLSISDYFKNSNHQSLSAAIVCTINLTIIIMHLFFIKGYSCLIKSIKA